MKRIILIIAVVAIALAAEASRVAYSYDANGRVTRADYGNGKGYTYRYDAAGRLVSRTALTPAGGRRRAISHGQTPPAKP